MRDTNLIGVLIVSELVIGHTLSENNVPVTVAPDGGEQGQQQQVQDHEENTCETGHSRNSSNTSQLSKASGYSSIHSHTHSRQSSSGDSGHIRLDFCLISRYDDRNKSCKLEGRCMPYLTFVYIGPYHTDKSRNPMVIPFPTLRIL